LKGRPAPAVGGPHAASWWVWLSSASGILPQDLETRQQSQASKHPPRSLRPRLLVTLHLLTVLSGQTAYFCVVRPTWSLLTSLVFIGLRVQGSDLGGKGSGFRSRIIGPSTSTEDNPAHPCFKSQEVWARLFDPSHLRGIAGGACSLRLCTKGKRIIEIGPSVGHSQAAGS